MPSCPSCGTDTPEGASACPGCGLALELFGPIRETVGVAPDDPGYRAAVKEIIEAIGAADASGRRGARAAEIAHPARFPATPPPGTRRAPRAKKMPLPQLPSLPEGSSLAARRQQIAEFLELARHLSMEVGAFEERARALKVVDEPEELDHLDRELFVHVAAQLSQELEELLGRYRDLAHFLPPTVVDTQLEEARTILATGDLAGAQRAIRTAATSLSGLSEEWGPVEKLVREGEMLKQTAAEFGGDSSPASPEFDEGRRLARNGQRTKAEEVLTRASIDLWAIVKPLVEDDLATRMEIIVRLKSAGVNVKPVLADLREFGTLVTGRNYAGAIEAYRRAGQELEALTSSPRVEAEEPAEPVKSRPTVPPP
jgi:hypothetical protein